MNFRVESSPRLADGLIFRGSRAIGVLMDLAMRAVHENGFGGVTGKLLILEKPEITILGESVEKLMDGRPRAELRRQSPPRAAIAKQVPEGIEVLIGGGYPTTRMYKVVDSNPEFLDLIFLASHGADPA